MPHYKLFASESQNPALHYDEIVLSRDETGEIEHSLSLHEGREIPEDLLDEARGAASLVGMRVEEIEAPQEAQENQDGTQQEPSADTASAGPSVTQTDESTSQIDQQKASGRAAQQDTAQAGTAGSSSSGSNPTVTPVTPTGGTTNP